MRKAVIRVASGFPEDARSDLKAGLREKFGNDVSCEFVPDDSVIGGFVVNVDGTIYDWSLSTQLKRLKKELSE